jgi:hypothetical protein
MSNNLLHYLHLLSFIVTDWQVIVMRLASLQSAQRLGAHSFELDIGNIVI